MVRVDTTTFFQLWKDREKQLGRELSLTEASEVTNLAPETIRNIREGKTTRFDAPVLTKLCQLLNIPPGPVPFLVYDPGEAGDSATTPFSQSEDPASRVNEPGLAYESRQVGQREGDYLMGAELERKQGVDMLSLLTEVYQGLSPEQVEEIEKIAFDRSHFFTDRGE